MSEKLVFVADGDVTIYVSEDMVAMRANFSPRLNHTQCHICFTYGPSVLVLLVRITRSGARRPYGDACPIRSTWASAVTQRWTRCSERPLARTPSFPRGQRNFRNLRRSTQSNGRAPVA